MFITVYTRDRQYMAHVLYYIIFIGTTEGIVGYMYYNNIVDET